MIGISQTYPYRSVSKLHDIYSRHQKLGVIRTLIDRMQTIVTAEEDKKCEEERTRQALSTCGYPKWTVDKVKQQMAQNANTKTTKKTKHDYLDFHILCLHK